MRNLIYNFAIGCTKSPVKAILRRHKLRNKMLFLAKKIVCLIYWHRITRNLVNIKIGCYSPVCIIHLFSFPHCKIFWFHFFKGLSYFESRKKILITRNQPKSISHFSKHTINVYIGGDKKMTELTFISLKTLNKKAAL